MPLQLETFRTLAETQRHQQVLLDSDAPAPTETIKTRGSFFSWVANLFRGDSLRGEQSAVAQAFMQALQSHVQQDNADTLQLTTALRTDYSSAMQAGINLVRGRLANQLAGTRALTTDDISSALSFIALVQQETLTPLMQEARELAALETAGQRRQAATQVLDSFNAAGGAEKSPGERLTAYINGHQPDAQAVAATQTMVESLKDNFLILGHSIRELKQMASTSENPELLQSMQASLEHVKSLKGPVDALEWFNEGHRQEGLAKAQLDTKSVHLGNGDDITNPRSARELVAAFRSGEKLSAQDCQFLDAWANRFTSLQRSTHMLMQLSNGEKEMRTLQNVLSDISEASYRSMAAGDIQIEAELLDGIGGVTETPYRDQAILTLWDRRDAMVATMQAVSLLQEQARAAVAASGDIALLAEDHVDPFRPEPADENVTLHEPDPDAQPARSSLSHRHVREILVGQETVDYHAPAQGAADDAPSSYGLKPAQRTSRTERVHLLNAQLGLSEDGKTHQPGHAAAARHRQQAVTVDPRVEPGRSIPQVGKGANKGFDHEVGSGRDEAARPLRPRTSDV